jgi:tetratricopeptide (TPR) repeat protein
VDRETNCVPRAAGQSVLIAKKNAVEADPNDPVARCELAQRYQHDEHDIQQAIEQYKAALRIDPKCREAHRGMSDCYWESGRHEESFSLWKQAKQVDPEWRWPYVQLAFDYNDLDRYDEAIGEWKRLIELEPDVAGLHSLLADVYLNANRYDEAIVACKETLRLKPDHVKAHYNLAKAYLQLGKRELALQEYQALKGLDAKKADRLFVLIGNGSGVTVK